MYIFWITQISFHLRLSILTLGRKPIQYCIKAWQISFYLYISSTLWRYPLLEEVTHSRLSAKLCYLCLWVRYSIIVKLTTTSFLVHTNVPEKHYNGSIIHLLYNNPLISIPSPPSALSLLFVWTKLAVFAFIFLTSGNVS